MKDLKELHLLGKLVKLDECPILLDSQPDENWQKDWQVMAGEWTVEDGYLIGAERGNKGGILFSRESYDCDVIFTFTAKTVLPATRDVNGVFAAHWDTDIDYLGNAYVFGFNGWLQHHGKQGARYRQADQRLSRKGSARARRYRIHREIRGAVQGS